MMGRAGLALSTLLAGCLQPTSDRCADGRTCPGGTTCDMTNGLCVPPIQAEACLGHIDGNACRFSGEYGVCNVGTCVPTTWTPTVLDTASSGGLGQPLGIALDRMGVVYVADRLGHRVVRADSTGVVTMVAGTGTACAQSISACGDGGLATEAQLDAPAGVAVDSSGNVYISDTGDNRIRIIDAGGTIATFAGTGSFGFGGDGGAASAGVFRNPTGLYLDQASHVLYVADTGNHVIRAIDLATGMIHTVAGTPAVLGFFGDGHDAITALLYQPQAITKCANGDLFIADTGNNRVRRVDAGTNMISTAIGDGSVSSAGDGGPASIFPVDAPLGIACDAIGNVYVTSKISVREVAADASGVIDGSGLALTIYGEPPRDTFPASATGCLTGLALSDAKHVEVIDACSGLLVHLQRGPT